MQKVQTFLLAIITGALVVPAVVNYQKQRAEEMRLDQAYERCTPAFVSRRNREMFEAAMEGRRIFNENYIKEHGEEPLHRPDDDWEVALLPEMTIESCIKNTLLIRP